MLLIILFLLLLLFVLWAIFDSVVIVKENTAYVVEALGKFSRVMPAGLHLRVPIIERIVEKITLKQQNFTETGRYHTKDEMTADVSTNLIFAVIPTVEGVRKFTYTLAEREKTLATTLQNALRTSIAKETYAEILEKKDTLTREVWDELNRQFQDWGIEIISFQIMGVRNVQTI